MTSPTSRDPFGRGLVLSDGDLEFDGGALVEVDGIANLVQALTLRILTPNGTDRFNTGYGLDVKQAFNTPNGVRMVKELLKLSLVSTLSSDPRVGEIRKVTFDDDPDLLAANPDLRAQVLAAHNRRTWTVEVDLETVAGSTVTLPVSLEV